ncbi:MAG: argininosuccinate lyase [Alphaproteobacteria bacterium]|nr:argininosuccinate lyase [Alphaproteobacteria bacterium]
MKKKAKKSSNPMWGGHYASGPAEAMQRINECIDTDKRLYLEDITASKAHASMLGDCKIISSKDAKAIINGLDVVRKEIENGNLQFTAELEDVHMNVEARLAQLIGDPAGRLHTARSRNDQVATDFRLWIRNAIDRLDEELKLLQTALIDQAETNADTIMPGFTHLQPAQPVTFGHHLLAYVEMLARDRSRFSDARARMNECPLGAAALAGTSFPINREKTSAALGFDRPMANSLDAVSDRDFAMEFLSAAGILSVHMSRLAEELVIWTSDGFRYVRLSESFTTGSSIMPQKRNPDAAELIRGKSGMVIGSLTNLLVTMKGLPLAYNKDLQETKRPAMEVADQLSLMISAMTGMIRDMKADKSRMNAATNGGFLTATDLADWLVINLNMPFRKAHHVTGGIVRIAETKGCRLDELTLDEMRKIEPKITKDAFKALNPAGAANSRKSYGGTSPSQVKKQVNNWRKSIAGESK